MIKLYPKILNVKPLNDKKLVVLFEGNVKKMYDCQQLLNDPNFQDLSKEAVFNTVRVDQGGYGVSWNESMDLSESELWLNGVNYE